jgi:hypothetical protein
VKKLKLIYPVVPTTTKLEHSFIGLSAQENYIKLKLETCGDSKIMQQSQDDDSKESLKINMTQYFGH